MLYAILSTQVAYGALASLPTIAIPEDLFALTNWIELSKAMSPFDAKKAIAEKINANENIPRAYLIGAALNEQFGSAHTILFSILNKRLLISQGLSGPSKSVFIYELIRKLRRVSELGCFGL